MTEKYEFIDAECATMPGEGDAPSAVQMCEWLEVSPSGFYDWRKRPESETAKRRELMKIKIQALFEANNAEYGHRRIHAALVRGGESIDDETVRKYMRELGLEPCQPKPWRHSLTEQDGTAGPIPDLVNRDFTSEVPGAKMVGDITYSAQPAVMCSPRGRPPARADLGCGAGHNQRPSRNARSWSPGLNWTGAGIGSVSRSSTACLAARSASRY